jgi:formate--tetrahydrofolate ligase
VRSSLEIAQEAELIPIEQIAEGLGLEPDEIEPYGRFKAKVGLDVIDRLRDRPDGKIVVVAGMTPTRPGRARRRRSSVSPRASARSASGRSRACASRRSARCSGSRAAPPAAA